MGRRLLNLITLVSLLLCAGSAALLVRSYLVSDFVIRVAMRDAPERRRDWREWSVYGGRGVAFVAFTRQSWVADPSDGDTPVTDGAGWKWERFDPESPLAGDNGFWTRRGFAFDFITRDEASDRFWYSAVCFPLWLPACLFGVAPGVLLARRLTRRRRARAGHCPRCGYDVRATPGRCPECGTDVAADLPSP